MLLRDNPCGVYRSSFHLSRDGVLIVRPRFILAIGRILEYVWR